MIVPKTVILIDIREPYEYNEYNIQGSINIPSAGLMFNPEMFLNKTDTYYIMCISGNRSMFVCEHLIKLGYKVYSVDGGINNYGY